VEAGTVAEAVLLSYSSASSAPERHITKLLDFFGVGCAVQSPTEFLVRDSASGDKVRLFCSSRAFLELIVDLKKWPEMTKRWSESVHSAFIYSDPDHTALAKLASVLGGNGARIEHHHDTGARHLLIADDPELCGVMSGLKVEAAAPAKALLVHAPEDQLKNIISVDEYAACIFGRYEGVALFISTTDQVVNLDEEPLRGIFDIREYVLSALPITLYVKWAFKHCCWRPGETSACLIIDDPLLKRSHGFIDFKELMSLMNRHNFSTNIAFIPWNWRRSDHEIASVFRDNSRCYSISVHGCDHTRAEYGSQDAKGLATKTRKALTRMTAHEKLTGIRYDPVMVFPQGIFSTAAMEALKHSGLIAAVNNDTISSDTPALRITIADVWDVALMKYCNFPLFTRRYPWEGIENFAFDALLGKPALAIIHHDYCSDHCARLITFIERMNAVKFAPTWRSLAEAVSRSWRERELSSGLVEIEMYAAVLRLKNRSEQPRRFLIKKRECEPSAIREICDESGPIAWNCVNGHIEFSIELEPGRTRALSVKFHELPLSGSERESLPYRVKAMSRRYLCEIRDNYITTARCRLAGWRSRAY
jgi:hypothetical protein